MRRASRPGRRGFPVELDDAQFDALHAEADRRGISARALVRDAIRVVTGQPSSIPLRKRHKPVAENGIRQVWKDR